MNTAEAACAKSALEVEITKAVGAFLPPLVGEGGVLGAAQLLQAVGTLAPVALASALGGEGGTVVGVCGQRGSQGRREMGGQLILLRL